MAVEQSKCRTISRSCDLCGGDGDVLYVAEDLLHGIGGQFTYVKCRTCGLVYMNPQVVPEDLGSLYPDEYTPHRSKARSSARSARALRSSLRKRPFVKTLFEELDSQTRVLDVGCGNGTFLHHLRSYCSCNVFGVDSSQTAVEAARECYGLDIFRGTLAEAPFADASFDVITAWWCLEHVPDPSRTVETMRRLLKDGGRCILGVPNVESFNARVFRDKWYHLDCPRHLFLYSPDTITRLLTANGFVVQKIVFDRSPRGLIGSLRYRFGDIRVPLKNRKRPPGLSILKRLFGPWSLLMALTGQSDLFVVSAWKDTS